MISAVVLAYNEERHLSACLASLGWADELLVVDSGSADRTRAIAVAGGARVAEHPFSDYGSQRQAALEMATGDWAFFVDADERVPPPLAAEVRAVANAQRAEAAWYVPRRNFFWGREVRHAGWAPDYQLRLLRRGRARYPPNQMVHEVAEVDGPTGHLRHPLIHLNYDSWPEFLAKQWRYAALEARRRRAEGWRLRPWSPLALPARAFWRRFVTLRGHRDGLLGMELSLAMAWCEFVTCRHLAGRES